MVVPVDDAAAARPPPLAKAAGVAAIVMGATTTVRSATFFTKFCQRTWGVKGILFLCSWTRPKVSKATPLSAIGAATSAVVPHLGDRGACRRRSCSATAAPREGARRRGHGNGRHHPRPQRSFFPPNSDQRATLFPFPKLCSWTSPAASKPRRPPRRRQASRPW